MSSSKLSELIINEAITGIDNQKVFNFNIFDCYYLHDHFEFWDKLSDDVKLFFETETGRVSFRYDERYKSSGIILRMVTIPSEIYHIFITGQVINGYKIFMRVRNQTPELFLDSEVSWKIGHEETRASSFRALTSHTDIIIFTQVDCSVNISPSIFSITELNIIPDCLMSKGYIEGPTGSQGITGVQGSQGISGNEVPGQIGSIGPEGFQGLIGSQGLIGLFGNQGPEGQIGLVGQASVQAGSSGLRGRLGPTGIMGSIGPIGSQGIVGQQGLKGPTGLIGQTGPIGPQGPTGPIGTTGPVGPSGPEGFVIGDNVIPGTSFISWFRSAALIASTQIAWQKTGNIVTLVIPGFISGPSTISAGLVATLPVEVHTSNDKNLKIPTIISIDGTINQVALLVGPTTLTILKDIDGAANFTAFESIEVFTMTIQYLGI